MSKDILNDTIAYDLIQAIKITNRKNPDMKFIFRTTDAKITTDDKYFVTWKTKSFITSCEYGKKGIKILNAFKKLNSFCESTNNKNAAIDMIVDMCKLNSDDLKVKIIVFPTIRDKEDIRFTVNELFK